MKRLIWMIFITLLTAGVAAQTKVVERSAKKVPGWLNTAVEDYLVVIAFTPFWRGREYCSSNVFLMTPFLVQNNT